MEGMAKASSKNLPGQIEKELRSLVIMTYSNHDSNRFQSNMPYVSLLSTAALSLSCDLS